MTVWSMLEECVGQLDEPFRRSEIIGWFRRHHPEVNESTLGAHIQAATANAANRAQNNPMGARPPLLRRLDHGVYVRATRQAQPATGHAAGPLRRADAPAPESLRGADADVVLIGCVRTKRAAACAAAELFASPLFEGRRRYAEATGLPWYILSAKFGLLAPEDVIGPYDVYLADQVSGYRKAWGEFVAAQMERLEPGLRGRVIEVHAGAAYVDPLRAPLAARGAALVAPLAHLRQGEQVAWYSAHASAASARGGAQAARHAGAHVVDVRDLASLLLDSSRAVSSTELRGGGSRDLLVPGLYSWWVDGQGAADLSRGLGLPISAGLVYAGQAGATRWPSGKRSGNTLWGRIAGMHLGGAAEFSTFRRTLAAILRPVLHMSTEDDPRLSAWISAHLRVIPVPVTDPDSLGEIESAVLDALDPPLNLRGRTPTTIRLRLASLRRSHDSDVGSAATAPATLEPPAPHGREASVDQAERQFHRAMVAIYETAKRELDYNATRFLQMLSEQGGLATARHLLWSDKPSDGFTTLWQHGRLDLSVEAAVLREEFAGLFTEADRQRARERLELYGWRGGPN